jgi:hypothetical protein
MCTLRHQQKKNNHIKAHQEYNDIMANAYMSYHMKYLVIARNVTCGSKGGCEIGMWEPTLKI